MKVDGVFQGGGVKAIGFVGAICRLEENHIQWQRLAGNSAGAIIASLLAVGYSGNELKEMMIKLDYSKLLDKNKLQSIPILGKSLEIILKQGIYSGEFLEKWLTELFKAKGKTKFKDISINGKSTLKLIASDITRKEMLILPDDIINYKIDPAEMEIAKAVRMSIGIPLYFQPINLKYKGQQCFIVDGGVFSNFPIWIFDVECIPRWPTFGLKFYNEPVKNKSKIKSLCFLSELIDAIIDNCDEKYIKDKDKIRTISIPTVGVKTTEFNITKQKSLELFTAGYNSADEFIKRWDFQRYITLYRKL